MLPERSANGLAAEYLLHGVNAVVWTEGGEGTDSEGERADDIQFWRAIFQAKRPDETFRFKPYGSKNEVLQVALQIQANQLSNVIACMDRDHDDLTGEMLIDENILYTRLYAWENEVWTPTIVSRFFDDIYSGNVPQAADIDLQAQTALFEKGLRWHIRSDVIRAILRVSRYLSSERRAIVQQVNKNLPFVRTAHLAKYRRSPRQKGQPRLSLLARTNQELCVGHLLADFYYQTLRVLASKYANITSLPREMARAGMISKFSDIALNLEPSHSYYREVLSRLRLE